MNETNFTPINKQAAISMSKGFDYISNKNKAHLEGRNPLPIMDIPKKEKNQTKFNDLTGFKFARFTVIGRYKLGKGWVVRCNCGVYTVRSVKAINNKENIQDRCEECRHLAFIKREEVRRRTGKDTDIRDY